MKTINILYQKPPQLLFTGLPSIIVNNKNYGRIKDPIDVEIDSEELEIKLRHASLVFQTKRKLKLGKNESNILISLNYFSYSIIWIWFLLFILSGYLDFNPFNFYGLFLITLLLVYIFLIYPFIAFRIREKSTA